MRRRIFLAAYTAVNDWVAGTILRVDFLAAYTAVNQRLGVGYVEIDFLAAYTAVNMDNFRAGRTLVFLAAYTAVNKTKKPSTFQAPRAPAPKPGKTLFLQRSLTL